ncbi:N-acetylglucosamine-6-phosphate deacetylase [Flavihumibacter rivuli]|uniref:N-acetylglucosamine-6-phosphate deacetylase n=1 Tax=Flavihumibacter rivuli TaxID=2838156 RepID=UPI001BDF693C|nr:N-acetylglucosamine-6-phosphate deacetylase [Flavihumibacter rivuli]ULQ55620.1 N-acetylglucosamine-6-phosphate deacetylase [Flavihumibacter rivuli]
MSLLTRFTNGRVFTGEHFVEADVWVEADRIISLGTRPESALQVKPIDLQGDSLVPAFIDLQIYGGNGELFGEHPSIASLRKTVEYSVAGGATFIQPTVATNTNEIVFSAIDAIREYWKAGGKGVAGLHLEGPFLNPLRRGAHAVDCIQTPDPANIRTILEYGKGVVTMMTIAPELFSEEALQVIQEYNLKLSIGHSNATYAQANQAFSSGIPTCTHLFNAMSPLHHREPGLPGAILDHATACSSIVPDGFHVDWPMVRLASKLMQERLFIITDAVTANPTGNYPHVLKEDRYVLPDGTLSGSALTMLSSVRNCIHKAGIAEHLVLQMASLIPARVMGWDHERGRIRKDYRAELLRLDHNWELKGIYSNGEWQELI